MKFLEQLIEQIISNYEEHLQDVCIVLPNRRAGLYLKKYLSQKLKKVIWSPLIFSIEDFVCHITGLEIADQITLLFDLFSIYKKAEGKNAQSFDEFMNWASVLLNDYNDSDINLADTEKLFQYLNEAKAINLWNPENPSLTDHEKSYLDFFNSLGKYYKSFTDLLLEKNCGYQGLIYKKASEKIDDFITTSTFHKIIFAGFNALTLSEEKIIKTLLHSGKAEIYWDTDNYYLENKMYEAGDFIRKYRNEWGLKEFNWIENNYATSEKNIIITGIPLNIGQAELAGQIISEMKSDVANSENTALVLADENLLIPVLYSIPETVKDINITMGYPLSNSTVHSLFMNLFTLHENSKKYSSNITQRFYQKDILNLFNHPYFRIISNKDKKSAWLTGFLESVKRSNRIFYKSSEITSQLKDPAISALFSYSDNDPSTLLSSFSSLIGLIRDTLISGKKKEKQNSDIDIEYLFHYSVIITKVQNLINEYGLIHDIKTLRKIFSGFAETATIPFYGEPLKGLQIMGMLETRALDFDNIILLSVNENILPAGKFSNTFVPYDIRKEMNLSTYRQKESIFAYHFYRLLQRAKNIHIIYNTESDSFGSGEKSRFITQICEELPKYNNKINIQQKIIIQSSSLAQKNDTIIVEKTKEILNDIESLAEKGFSPSALNTYISCSLKFYFQYIEKIEETEETAETIDAATLGSVVHFVLHELYNEFTGKNITIPDIKKMFGHVETLVKKGFKEYYPDGDIEVGKNLLISKVAIKFISNFLQSEIKFIEDLNKSNKTLAIVKLEEYSESSVNAKTHNGKVIPVKIKGFIDRVDKVGETLRIIDYKTGIVKKEELKFESWEDLFNNTTLSKSLQLLIYAFLYNKKFSLNDLSAGIISFRSLSKGFLPVVYPGSSDNIIDPSAFAKVEEILETLIESIFSKDNAFKQTDDPAICKNCAYNLICNK